MSREHMSRLSITSLLRTKLLAAFGSVAGGFLAYVLAAVAVYYLFYSFHPYDRWADTGATAFKVWFWIAFFVHQVIALATSAVVARLLDAPVLLSIAATFAVVIVLALPLIEILSFMNNCSGLEYPLSGPFTSC